MKKKIAFISGLFLALLVILSASGMSQAAPIVLKLGNIQAPTSSASIACERMAKLAAERSNGQLKIESFPLFPAGQRHYSTRRGHDGHPGHVSGCGRMDVAV